MGLQEVPCGTVGSSRRLLGSALINSGSHFLEPWVPPPSGTPGSFIWDPRFLHLELWIPPTGTLGSCTLGHRDLASPHLYQQLAKAIMFQAAPMAMNCIRGNVAPGPAIVHHQYHPVLSAAIANGTAVSCMTIGQQFAAAPPPVSILSHDHLGEYFRNLPLKRPCLH